MMKKKSNKKRNQFTEVWGRLVRNRVAMAALVLVIVIVLLSAFSEQIAPYDYTKQDLRNTFASPSLAHLCGTDNLGRDIFSRVLVGGKISLLVGLMAIAFATVIGCFLGATAGYFGGVYELVVMKLMDILMAIPQFLLAVSVSAALGSGVLNTALAVGIGSIPRFVRMMRAEVLTVKGKEFVESARASGARDGRIIWRHIVPNALSSTIVNVTLCIPGAILAISSLSFIGLGVQPPTPEWGSILAQGRQYIRDFWPMVTFPGVAIMLTVIGFNLFGDGLRDAMDPKLKQ
jgi:peptide/nickel transport system permease protein